MEVVSAEVISLLPEEIMDTTVIEEDRIEAVTITSEHGDLVPMDTELDEIANPDEGKNSEVLSNLEDHVTVISNNSTPLVLNDTLVKIEVNPDSGPPSSSNISPPGPTAGTSSENQVVLNPISESSDHPISSQTVKSESEGQQFVVTTFRKSRQSVVLSLPSSQTTHLQVPSQLHDMDPHVQKQIKMVTLDRKPGVGASNTSASGNSALNASIQPSPNQLKTLPISKKLTSTSAATPMITKVIIAKPVHKNVISGRILPQNAIGTAPNTITISESGVTGANLNTAAQQLANKIAISPLKSPNKTVKPAVQTLTMGTMNTTQFKTIIPLTTPPNVQQIQVPGTKTVVLNPQVRMSVPIAPAQSIKNVIPKPITGTTQMVTTSQPQQRLIMPATALPQIQPNLTNLPPGTVLAPAPGAGNMGYAVLPAQYVTQLQQTSYVSISSNNGFSGTSNIQTQAKLPINGSSTSESGSRPRKPCNCTKSQCLKLYCDCFANGEFCNSCNCTNCFNNLDHEAERLKAIKACLDRNPEAFKPKIGKGKEGESDRRHSKGCNCKRSGCLKNYCECYEAKIMCSSICKCIGCKNFEESPERKTLMHLADAAEVRVQQQTAAKTKLSSQISDLLTRTTPSITSGGGKLPFTFVTKEVAEATCECLLAQAEEGEKNSQTKAVTEHMILEEFGRCLMQIINSAGKAKGDACVLRC
ncbi:protein lin-54 homolog isoform X2 [Narcine bancroftii]|uniref:protein lin-54 homolog isoform X2 n=1 Tax=Narcine bancroftii TaxID=1343680 RepID=UPI0038312E54